MISETRLSIRDKVLHRRGEILKSQNRAWNTQSLMQGARGCDRGLWDREKFASSETASDNPQLTQVGKGVLSPSPQPPFNWPSLSPPCPLCTTPPSSTGIRKPT